MKQTELSPVIKKIISIIEEKNACKLKIGKSFNTYWLEDVKGICHNEFRFGTLGNYRLTISRVQFHRKRCGTMTAVLEVLKKFCEKYEIPELVIQSVSTKEMMNFCIKNQFEPSSFNVKTEDGILVGDYILKIKKEHQHDH